MEKKASLQTSRMIFTALAMIFFMAIFVGNASAFLDVKSFDPNVKNHGEIFIKDWLFLDKAEYKLMDYGASVIDVWAEGEYNLHKKTTLFTGVNFKNVYGGLSELRDVKFYTWANESYQVDVPVYQESCQDQFNEQNQTTDKVCNQVLVRTDQKTEWKSYWKEYHPGDELPESQGKWRLEGKRKANQKLDFVLEAHGKTFDEWAWWNSTFTKKKQILAQETSGSNLFNYTVNFTVTYDSDMQSNFSDIRFTDTTEAIEYPYWIESYTASTSAQVYVRIANINMTANQNTTLYMYYGNPTATSSSNKNNTFLFNDDFGGASLNTGLWGSYTGDAGDYINIKNNGLNLYHSTATNHNVGIVAKTTVPYPFKERFNLTYTTSNSATSGMFGACIDSDTGDLSYATFDANCAELQWGNWGGNIEAMRDDAGSTSGSPIYGITLGKTYWMEFDNIASTNRTYKINSTQKASRVADKTRKTPAIFAHGGAAVLNFTVADYRISTYAWREPTYTFGAEQQSNGLTVTLNSPSDSYNSTNPSVSFNCSATDETGVLNVTMILDGLDNYTVTGGAGQNVTLNLSRTLTEGSHNWTCRASDGSRISPDPVTATLRTIGIDYTAPNITLIYPNSSTPPFIKYLNIPLNFTVTDNYIASNDCGYSLDGGANKSLASICNGTTSVTSSDLFNTTTAKHTIVFYANDRLGNLRTANSTFYVYNYSTPYSSTAIENENTTLYFNIDTTNLTSYSANLTYNYTTYPMTFLENNGTTYRFSRTVTAPSLSATTNIPFNVSYSTNGFNYSSINYNQTVQSYSLSMASSCSAGLQPSACFIFADELNLTAQSIDTLEYNFRYGITNSTYKNVFGSLSTQNISCICLNSTIYNNYSVSYGELHYKKIGYTERNFYLYTGTQLSNSTYNLTLYLLPTSSATSFLFTFKNTNLIPYVEHYLSLLRWYPNLDKYNSVEMAKTDDKGQAIMRVQVEDASYRVGLYDVSGTLIKLLNPVSFACISSPCEYSTLVETTTSDYTSFFNVQTSLDFNETTNIWTFIWSDPSLRTQNMTLLVTREGGSSTTTICNNVGSGAVGVLTCNSSAYSGTIKATAYRTASPATPIASKIVQIGKTVFTGAIGLFISFLLFISLALIGAVSPVLSILLGLIALVPAMIFGSITIPIFIALGVVGAIVIHFMKRSS